MGKWWAELPGRLLGPMFALDAARVGRRLSTFAARWAYLAVLALVLGTFFANSSGRLGNSRGVASPGELARFAESFFWVYAVCQFLLVVAVTPSFTAAAITDEKERKTLDFLLVTDLSGREIVFGKLAARVGMLFTFVLAGLPILSLVQFFGGIDPELLLLAAAVTLATVLSLSGLGLAGSVAFRCTRDAVVFTYAVPVAYVVLATLGYAEALSLARRGWVGDWAVAAAGRSNVTNPVALWRDVIAIRPLAVRAGRSRTRRPRRTPRFTSWLRRRGSPSRRPDCGRRPRASAGEASGRGGRSAD